MKRNLRRMEGGAYYYRRDGKRILGFPPSVSGDLGGVWGDLTGVSGNLSYVQGNLTEVSGSLTGVWGDLTTVSGNLDDCEITKADREKGVDIDDLVIE